MAQTATVTWGDDEFYFVSDDGETFYEVNALPGGDSDLDRIRPLGKTETMHRIGFARRWLQLQNGQQDRSVQFGEVA